MTPRSCTSPEPRSTWTRAKPKSPTVPGTRLLSTHQSPEGMCKAFTPFCQLKLGSFKLGPVVINYCFCFISFGPSKFLSELSKSAIEQKNIDFSLHVPSGLIFEIRWLQKALQSRNDSGDDVTKRVTSSVTAATTLNQQINMIDVLSESHIRVKEQCVLIIFLGYQRI